MKPSEKRACNFRETAGIFSFETELVIFAKAKATVFLKSLL